MDDHSFWREKKPRNLNPTYQSRSVHLSMWNRPFDIERFSSNKMPRSLSVPNLHNQQSNAKEATLASSVKNPEGQGAKDRYHSKLLLKPSEEIPIKISKRVSSVPKLPEWAYKSQFSTSKDIFDRQEKDFDIIKASPKPYKSSLQMFPKYHLESHDSDYKTRQAYVSGDISAIKRLHQPKQSFMAQKGTNIMKITDDYHRPHFVHKKTEPIDQAFKITESPEITRKKKIIEL